MALPQSFTTRSTFRPPPFVSKDTGYPLPSHHTPAPTQGAWTSPLTASPLPSVTDNHSLVLRLVREGAGVSDDPDWWNLTDVNFTTLSASVTSDISSAGPPHPDPHHPHHTHPGHPFPAGYPSGYTWPHIIIASIIVTVVILIIVVGNFLVMWAIVRDKNLKGTQNYFIGSLALADFLLGLFIVPFSLANELMGYWHFGTVFCEVWKATDVLLCTASISSLCLISLDRYWSITKAIHYSRQRTPKRAAIMIFIVWFVSAAICIPPLIGWNQPAPDSDWPVCALSEDIGYVLYSSMGSFYIPAFIMVFVYFKIYQAAKARARKNVATLPRGTHGDKSEQKSTESSGEHHPNQRQQDQSLYSLDNTLTNTMTPTMTHTMTFPDSSLQENPLKIQPLTSSSLEELSEGMMTMSECKCVNEILEEVTTAAPTSEDEGGQAVQDFRTRSLSLPCRALKQEELTKLISTDSDSCDALAGPVLNLMDRGRLAFSMPTTTTTTTTDTDSSMDLSHLQLQHHPHHPHPVPPPPLPCLLTSDSAASLKTASPPPSPSEVTTPVNAPPLHFSGDSGSPDNGAIQQFRILEPKQNGNVEKSPGSLPSSSSSSRKHRGLLGSLRRQLFQSNNGRVGEKQKPLPKKKEHHRKAAAAAGGGGGGSHVEEKNDFFSAERQKRKLAKARERRATLVLGLVMAAFILCWLPFFLLYVVSAFCEGCIPIAVFTVFFWIGYCNSALNPLIYTVFNRDFRRAFHRILFPRRRGRR